MQLLGIDNVFFEVKNLQEGEQFYEKLGFKKKLALLHLSSTLFSIGDEEPGLIITEKKDPSPSKLWIEVVDATHIKKMCSSEGIEGALLETTTGLTFEVLDPSQNILGFADYSKNIDLARIQPSIIEEFTNTLWNKKEHTAIEKYVSPSVIIHSLLGDFHGHQAMYDVASAWLEAFPDMHVETIHTVSQKDLVTLQWRVRATHLGYFQGRAPTGKPILYSGVSIYRLRQNKIEEYWAYIDMNHLFSQMERI